MKRFKILSLIAMLHVSMTWAQAIYEVAVTTDILNAPNLNGAVVGTLHAHDIVTVTETTSGWAAVTSDYGNGYVEIENLIYLDGSAITTPTAATPQVVVSEQTRKAVTLKEGTPVLVVIDTDALKSKAVNKKRKTGSPCDVVTLAGDIVVDGVVIAKQGDKVTAHYGKAKKNYFKPVWNRSSVFAPHRPKLLIDGVQLADGRLIEFAKKGDDTQQEKVSESSGYAEFRVFVAQDYEFK